MPLGKSGLAIVALAVALSAAAQTPTGSNAAPPAPAQSAKPNATPDGGVPAYIKEETTEQRKARLGTAEDPGLDPNPMKPFWRFGKSYHIEKFERKWAAYDADPGWVRPMAMVNFAKEIYQQNDKYVWVWMLNPESIAAIEAATAPPPTRFNEATIKFLKSIRDDFTKLAPADSETVIRFEESSEGLPTSGSWRNALTVADMNDDGFADIVAPPERAGGNLPAIFLGDGKGHWKYWSAMKWPRGLDYGAVVTADFNRDGRMDVAFAVHLRGIYVFLGDGKGNFTEVTEGLPRDFPTRRVVTPDVDGDGYPDLVALSEGPSLRAAGNQSYGKLRVYYNRGKGQKWEGANISGPGINFGGDALSFGDLNGDKVPDFVASSVYFGNQDVIHLSQNRKRSWRHFQSDGLLIPSLSYYWANATGKFSSKKYDDAIISYVHFWPNDLDPHVVPKPEIEEVVNLDHVAIRGKELKRTPIARWGSNRPVAGIASGDFDGDGNLDFIYARFDPREAVIMLGDGKGGFKTARIEGLTLQPLTNYDIRAADVNGDGKPDVVMMYEASEPTALGPRNGSIQVFLNRGAKVQTSEK